MLVILLLLVITAAMSSREAFTMRFESTIEEKILSAWEEKQEKIKRKQDDYEKELLSILSEIRGLT